MIALLARFLSSGLALAGFALMLAVIGAVADVKLMEQGFLFPRAALLGLATMLVGLHYQWRRREQRRVHVTMGLLLLMIPVWLSISFASVVLARGMHLRQWRSANAILPDGLGELVLSTRAPSAGLIPDPALEWRLEVIRQGVPVLEIAPARAISSSLEFDVAVISTNGRKVLGFADNRRTDTYFDLQTGAETERPEGVRVDVGVFRREGIEWRFVPAEEVPGRRDARAVLDGRFLLARESPGHCA
jgi:hypothetical protein